MRRKSWPIITAGLLLSGIPVAVWLSTGPSRELRKHDTTVSCNGSPAGVHGVQRGPDHDATGKRRRVGEQIPALSRILADLEAANDDDFAARLEKNAAAWPKDDLPSAVAGLFAMSAPGPSADSLRQALLHRWALHAPAAAADWAGSLPTGPARQPAIMQVALAWHSTHADAAWNWTYGLEDDAPRESALISLAYEVSRDDPQLAIERSETLRDGPDRRRLIEHAVANWAAIDPQAALACVKEIADPSLQQTALGCVAASWSESDPCGAATLVAEMMEAGPAQERAVASIIQRWARMDLEKASAWVATFPEGRMKQNSLDHIAAIAATSGPEP